MRNLYMTTKIAAMGDVLESEKDSESVKDKDVCISFRYSEQLVDERYKTFMNISCI